MTPEITLDASVPNQGLSSAGDIIENSDALSQEFFLTIFQQKRLGKGFSRGRAVFARDRLVEGVHS